MRIEEYDQWSAATACLEEQDARCLVMKMTYKDQICIKASFICREAEMTNVEIVRSQKCASFAKV